MLLYPFRTRPKYVGLALILLAAGCGTLFNSSTKGIAMSSTPDKAEVFVDGNRMGTTPLTLELDNQENHAIVFKKEGYKDVTCDIKTKVGAGYVVLDILGGLIPVVIDAATGEWESLGKETCNVTLPSEA